MVVESAFLGRPDFQSRGPQTLIFGPDIFVWGGGLPREGVGAKKIGMSFETQGTRDFCRLSGPQSGLKKAHKP